MIATIQAPPAAEPVGLAEAKEYPCIGGDGQDGVVGELIAAAQPRVDAFAGETVWRAERCARV